MPLSVLQSVIVLAGLTAIVGLWLGLQRSRITETDVINAYAARYVEETGGAVSDCAARPGEDARVWMIISCGHAPEITRYFVDRAGRQTQPVQAQGL